MVYAHAISPHPHRAVVPPVPADVRRPRWSVMIPTYHSADYLADALRSVLRQDPGPPEMQIEVVDDCSVRDDPEAVTREIGGSRVSFFRQPKNVGHVGNFQTCLERSRGVLVHLLHGDDAVRPGFYATLGAAFDAVYDLGAAFCRFIAMDAGGHWRVIAPLITDHRGVLSGWLEMIATGQRIQPPSIVVKREVYEHLGGFDDRIQSYGEDWEMWTRIAAYYPVWYEPEPLALYRVHGGSLTSDAARTGQNMRDLERAIAINREVLPPAKAEELSRIAARESALAAIRRSHRALDAGETRVPLVQLREAVRLSRSPRVLAGSVRLFAHWARVAGRNVLRDARVDRS